MAQPLRRAARQMPSSNPEPRPDDALARRAEDLETLRQREHDTAFKGDQREETGELSIVGQHPADTSDFTYQRELQQTTQELLEREKAQVEAAIRARDTGSYGTCQQCGRPIPPERLHARPEATLCVDSQRRIEATRT